MNRAAPRRSVPSSSRSLLGAAAGAAALLGSALASAQTLAPVPTGFSAPGSPPPVATQQAAPSPAPVPPRPAPPRPASAPAAPGAAMGYIQTAPPSWGDPSYGVYPPPTGYGAPPEAPAPLAPTAQPDAAAPPPDASDGPAVDIAVVSQLPLMIGGQATFELPYRILLQGELGALPPAYINALDSVLVSAGTYDSTTSSLVRNGLKNSLVARFSAGIRPFAKHGFELSGGYTLASFGGGVSARDAVAAVAGISLPSSVPDGDIAVKTTIHNVHATIGWRWVIADHFVIRASLGYLQSLSSSSHVEVPSAVSSIPEVATRLPQVNQALDTRLNDTYTKYGKMPLLGLSLGYRF
ncbi:MAG: hypothetical protein U0359_16935 [Byssovorax sp.]